MTDMNKPTTHINRKPAACPACDAPSEEVNGERLLCDSCTGFKMANDPELNGFGEDFQPI